jgi:hypothetical protein
MLRAWSTCSSAAPFVAPVTSKISQINIILAPAAAINNAQPEFFAQLSLLQQPSSPVTMLPKLSSYIPGRLPKPIEADT